MAGRIIEFICDGRTLEQLSNGTFPTSDYIGRGLGHRFATKGRGWNVCIVSGSSSNLHFEDQSDLAELKWKNFSSTVHEFADMVVIVSPERRSIVASPMQNLATCAYTRNMNVCDFRMVQVRRIVPIRLLSFRFRQHDC